MNKRKISILLCVLGLGVLAACSEIDKPLAVPAQAAAVEHQTQFQSEPTPVAIVTMTDPQQIVDLLTKLNEKRMEQINAREGWRHIVKTQRERSGNLRGMPMEWWVNDNRGQTCSELMQIVYDQQGNVLETDILLLKDGPLSKTIQPVAPPEDFHIKVILMDEQSCAGSPQTGYEQILAYLRDPNPNVLKSVEAVVEGEQLVVSMTLKFSINQVTTTTFDIATGHVVLEKTQIYRQTDGALEGETEYELIYEDYDALPDETASLFAQALGSLEP
jgi:hypothetical protein